MNLIREDLGNGVSIETDGNAIRITLTTMTAEHATNAAKAMSRELDDGKAVVLTLMAGVEHDGPAVGTAVGRLH